MFKHVVSLSPVIFEIGKSLIEYFILYFPVLQYIKITYVIFDGKLNKFKMNMFKHDCSIDYNIKFMCLFVRYLRSLYCNLFFAMCPKKKLFVMMCIGV